MEVFQCKEGTLAVLDLIEDDQGVVRSDSYIVKRFAICKSQILLFLHSDFT